MEPRDGAGGMECSLVCWWAVDLELLPWPGEQQPGARDSEERRAMGSLGCC